MLKALAANAPSHVQIRFLMVTPPKNKVQLKLQEERVAAEVRHAVNSWLYGGPGSC